MEILRVLPKAWLSYVIGGLAHVPLPEPLGAKLVQWFCKRYAIDDSICELPISEYRSIGDFFVRNLKEGCRPIGSEPVYPADATLRGGGPITAGMLEQVKGISYTLESLLGSKEDEACFVDGFYLNLYLSPQDYHHVHSPVTGQIKKMTFIPGALWPVNDWSIHSIKNLFAVNERVVTYIENEQGNVAVVMVGAVNVGRISLSYDSLITNSSPWKKKKPVIKNYKDAPYQIGAGDRLGTFHLGSSVVMLFDQTYVQSIDVSKIKIEKSKVTFGSPIVSP